jgi:hypothetical protein
MSVIWVLLVAATGASPADSNQPSAATSPSASAASAATALPAAATESPARSAKELRRAVAESLRRANAAKETDRPAAVQGLVDLFNALGRDRQLPAQERQRLGAEIRSRLVRFTTQFRHELARNAQRPPSESGAGGGPAAEGLDDLVDLIQKTISPQDWVLAQRIGGAGGAGQPAAGMAGQGGGGGAFGGIEQQTEANGQALVDLIQTTIAPETWDIRGGPGTIVYFNPLRALVVRQTGEGHDALGDLLGGLRR